MSELEQRLVKELGERYQLGKKGEDGRELLFRYGKAEFRPTRMRVSGTESEPRLDFTVDVRLPKDTAPEETATLVEALESRSLSPRGFERVGDETKVMETEAGEQHGFVRTLEYRRSKGPMSELPMVIRSIVESIDNPVVVGIHEASDVVARKPITAPKKPSRIPTDPMEKWEYTLAGGMLRSLTVIVDPNIRTLEVVERKLLAKQQLGQTLKLAHVSKFGLRNNDGEIELVAVLKEAEEVVPLARGLGDEFAATAERMAKKVFVPIERM